MHDKIGSKLHEAFASDSEAPDQAVFLSGAEATNEALMATLHETAPSLIVTTSHGSVSYDEHDDEHVSFGALVDQREQTLNVDALVDSWQPRGAIWYAHACCSAGVDGLGSLADLFAPDSVNGRMLREASSRGARVATWAKRLLGARAPLRAFIGHVEPTFDWTLRRPGSEGAMASAIVEALYMNLLNEEPVGMALSSWYRPVGGIRSQYEAALQEFRRGADNLNDLLFYQLTAMDMSRTVILGDPTVALTRQ